MASAAGDPDFAPLGRRAAAGLIDGGLLLGSIGAVMGGAIALLMVMGNDLARAGERLERLGERVGAPLRAAPWAQLLNGASALATIGMRNTRSPGMRAMHIHRADARTGGSVTLRSSAIRQLAGFALTRLTRRMTRPAFERYRERSTELGAELAEFQRQHPDDPEAAQTFYGSHPLRIGTASCCGWMLVPIAAQHLTTLLTPRRQSLLDWIAGIVVVRD